MEQRHGPRDRRYLTNAEIHVLRDEMHASWAEDPPSLRELLAAPVWALRLADLERLKAHHQL